MFMRNGMKATEEMRKVRFPIADRIKLIPVEAVASFKYALLFSLLFLVLSGLQGGGYSLEKLLNPGIQNSLLFMLIYLGSVSLTPALLPFLPGKAFAMRGAWAGLIFTVLIFIIPRLSKGSTIDVLEVSGWMLIGMAVFSFLGMMFTGASTYTSLSGVKKEMRFAVPAQIITVIAGFGIWITGLIV
jgi:acetyl-CoA decarbonylase/synthase complex subunit gamma